MASIPYDDIFAPGADPKTAYDALRPAYMKMRLEGRPQKIRFRDRELWFYPIDLSAWEKVMAELATAAGIASTRFAIIAG